MPENKKLARREVVAELLKQRGDLLVISGLGAASWDVAAAGDNPLNFTLWGAMGGAALMGLGVAMTQPSRPVLVLTGDGEQLMGLGGLATIAVQHPANLSIIVLDNERYGETGEQLTHTATGVNLAEVARACGFPQTTLIHEANQLEPLRQQIQASKGPLLAVIKIAEGEAPKVLPPRDGPYLKNRFRQALLGEY